MYLHSLKTTILTGYTNPAQLPRSHILLSDILRPLRLAAVRAHPPGPQVSRYTRRSHQSPATRALTSLELTLLCALSSSSTLVVVFANAFDSDVPDNCIRGAPQEKMSRFSRGFFTLFFVNYD